MSALGLVQFQLMVLVRVSLLPHSWSDLFYIVIEYVNMFSMSHACNDSLFKKSAVSDVDLHRIILCQLIWLDN